MSIPNYLSEVVRLAAAYPQEFADAHRPELGERAYAFIRRLAWVLHQQNPAVGLNGKRGTDELSWDALSIRWAGGLAVIDVISGAGGPNPQPAWMEVGGLSKWIQPTPVDAPSVTPSPVTPTYPAPAPQPPGLTADQVRELVRAELLTLASEIAFIRGTLQSHTEAFSSLHAALQSASLRREALAEGIHAAIKNPQPVTVSGRVLTSRVTLTGQVGVAPTGD